MLKENIENDLCKYLNDVVSAADVTRMLSEWIKYLSV